MTIANISDPNSLTGAPVQGSDGEKLGKVEAIYFDNDTDAPEWAAVKSGLFGGHVSLVPLAQGSWDGDTLTVPFDKAGAAGRAAPRPGRRPDHAADEDELYRHYGLTAGRSASGVDARAGERRDLTGAAGVQGRDTSGPTTDDAMTRSEEQLRVGTETREAGRARLRKHVVTEHQQVTVPVSHEEVTLEREPITDANRGDAYDGPATSPRRSTRSPCTPSAPWSRPRPSRWSGSSWAPRRSPSRRPSADQVRKEQIEVDDTDGTAGRGTGRTKNKK